MILWIRNIKLFTTNIEKTILFFDKKNIQKKLLKKPKFLDIEKNNLHIYLRYRITQVTILIY